jgi:hypothetical protein
MGKKGALASPGHFDMSEPLAQIKSMADDLKRLAAARDPPNDMSSTEAHKEMLKDAHKVAGQVRTLLFLSQNQPTAAHMRTCGGEVVECATKFNSWARVLVCSVVPAARKLIGPPCLKVLQTASAMVERVAVGRAVAHDVGLVEAAATALSQLPVTAAAVCSILLLESHALLEDAKSELEDSVREAVEGEAEEGDGSSAGGGGSGGGEEEEEEDGPVLWATPSISAPLGTIVTSAVELVSAAAAAHGQAGVAFAAGGEAQNDATCNMLVICGQAASTQVDCLMCAAHEDDLPSLTKYAASLTKLLLRLRSVAEKCGMGADEAARCVQLEGELAAAQTELAAAAAALAPA